jgi:hypothetical protein
MVMAHRAEQIGEMVIVQRVVHVASVASCAHQSQRSQQPQMMRRRAQAQADRCGEPLYGALTVDQLGEQPQPPG